MMRPGGTRCPASSRVKLLHMSGVKQRSPKIGETWDVAALSEGAATFVTLLGTYVEGVEGVDPATVPAMRNLSFHYWRLKDTPDTQRPHKEDEAYFVLSGSGAVTIEGVVHPLKRGSLVLVPRCAEHRFHDFEAEGLELLIIFSPDYSG